MKKAQGTKISCSAEGKQPAGTIMFFLLIALTRGHFSLIPAEMRVKQARVVTHRPISFVIKVYALLHNCRRAIAGLSRGALFRTKVAVASTGRCLGRTVAGQFENRARYQARRAPESPSGRLLLLVGIVFTRSDTGVTSTSWWRPRLARGFIKTFY